jgi:TusE/DsrC/DsvC family sulfur relay protein
MPAQILETDAAGPSQNFVEFGGRLIPLDEDGHLVNAEDWSEGLAVRFALQDGVELTNDHWQVIRFVREHYLRFKSFPMPRLLVKGLNRALGREQFTIKALYALFPDTPMRRSCRYSGIPQPAGCT